jgi:hypothetical protein
MCVYHPACAAAYHIFPDLAMTATATSKGDVSALIQGLTDKTNDMIIGIDVA